MNTAIIVCTHAVMAQGIKSAVEMICGPQEDFFAIGLAQGEGLEHVAAALTKTLDELAGQGKQALVFCDLYGATPFNGAYSVLGGKEAFIVTGVNLPMLLEAACSREDEDDLSALAETAMESGHLGIKKVQVKLEKVCNEDEDF